MEEEFLAEASAEGWPVTVWANHGGYSYGRHAHGYKKILCCLQGSIVFHTDEGDVRLTEGHRLVLPSGTAHAATVGPEGVRCAEAHVDAGCARVRSTGSSEYRHREPWPALRARGRDVIVGFARAAKRAKLGGSGSTSGRGGSNP
jgi:hypothetical protein